MKNRILLFQMFLGPVITSWTGSTNKKLGEQGHYVPLCQVSPAQHVAQSPFHSRQRLLSAALCGALCAPCFKCTSCLLSPIPGARLHHTYPAVREPERTTASERLQRGPWEEAGTCLRARGLCLKEKNADCGGERSCSGSALGRVRLGPSRTQIWINQEATRSKA